MDCPHCKEFAPDNNYRCPHCGKVLDPTKELSDFGVKVGKRRGLSANVVILSILVVLLAVLIYAALFKGKGAPARETGQESVPVSEVAGGGSKTSPVAAGSEQKDHGNVINAENPGGELNLETFIQAGKTTIFDFYSEFCPPCRKISPLLTRLDQRREDIVVCKVDINRPGTQGIDWSSPVARQYKLNSIPHFKIYDTTGNLTYEGNDAYAEILRLLQAEKIVQ